MELRQADQSAPADVPHGEVGPPALAVVAVLKPRAGLPVRRVTRVRNDLCGLIDSARAVAKQARRAAGWLGKPYEPIGDRIPTSPVVSANETGARVDGEDFCLWGVTSPRRARVPGHAGHAFAGHVVANSP